MREKINKLAQGIIDDSTPLILVEPKSIEYELIPGETVRMELKISSGNSVLVKGLAYSSDQRVRILTPAFGGSNVHLIFEALLKATDEDETFSGFIDLVTNGGEITVPFRFHRKKAEEDYELSCLRTLNDFALVAEEDKEKALRLFAMHNFPEAPFMQDTGFLCKYRLFSKCPDRETALDQFIFSCGIRINNYSEYSAAVSHFRKISSSDTDTFKPHRISASGSFKRHYYEYARMRLAYDMERGNKYDLIDGMIEHLDAIIESGTESVRIVLLKAEAEFLRDNIQETLMLMNSVSSVVRDNRQEMIHEYFLLEYLEIIANHRDRASFIRLCRKFIEEQHFNDLFIYVVKLDDALVSNDIQLRNFLTDIFSYGVRSPWLYYYYCMLLNDHPEYLYAPKSIDSHSLNFGRKYHIISDNISQAVVSASCTAYIKSDRKLISAHKTYAEGVGLDLNINGLYEYYLYTMPNDPNYVISDKVLNHYRTDDRLDTSAKTKLYSNIVKFKKKSTSIYKAYESRIIDFALWQLREQHINDDLLEIYRNVIRPEMIDQSLSEQFMKLVNCYRIRTDNPGLRNIIVTYVQAASENICSASDGNAIVPIFFPGEILLFQDTYGNRYADVPYTKEQLFVQNAFRAAAEKISPMSPVVRIRKTNDLIQKKNINGDDVLHLENEVYEKDLNDDAKAYIINRLIQYYNQHPATGYNPDFLLKINKLNLSSEERQDLCNAYVVCGCFSQAYDMICDFGYSGLTDKNLRTLCTNLVQQNEHTDEPLLLHLCSICSEKNLSDSIILDYLCEHYNGPTDTMYDILRKSINAHIDTHDMEERLIAQLIFINDSERINKVFEWYVSRRKASESIVKAYFTIKSAAYFYDNEKIDSRIFDYLENAIRDVSDIQNIPLIYTLAITKYYASLDDLSKSRIDISSRLVRYLLDNKYALGYLKKFNRYFVMPGDFMSRQIISYCAAPGKMIFFKSCIEPTEGAFLPEPASCTFMNVFVKNKVLFSGETWHYEVYETDGNDTELIDSGSIQSDSTYSDVQSSKFNELNKLCNEFAAGEDNKTIALMSAYASKECALHQLFEL